MKIFHQFTHKISISTSRSNKFLDVCNFVLLLVVRLHLIYFQFGFCLYKGRISTSVIIQFFLFCQMYSLIAYTIKKILRMADQKQNTKTKMIMLISINKKFFYFSLV